MCSSDLGRSFALLSDVEGRVEDVLTLADGSPLHPRAIWAALKDDPDLLQYRLVQREIGRFTLDLRVREGADFPAIASRARRALLALLGEVSEVAVREDPELGRAERARTGKLRAVESRVAPALRG